MIKSRLGRIEDKFFSLIPKALAFKPIDDIKDFVYSYVLDEKEVNIEVLRENVRTYQEMELTLESVKKRIAKLEKIEKAHTEILDYMQKDRMYEFFITQSDLDITKEKIENTKEEIQLEKYRLQQLEKELKALVVEKDDKQQMETTLRLELKQNSEFLALEEQEKELVKLKADEAELMEDKKELKQSVSRAMSSVNKLLEVQDVDDCIREYQSVFENIEKIKDVAYARELVEKVIRYKEMMHGKVQGKLAEKRVALNIKVREKNELVQKIEQLERKKLSYPQAVECVVSTIKEEFARIGRKPEPYVLCELLEIKDENWRNAVEGYMNTQRFYVLVEPENFDIALGIYDKLRREKKAYGVGLINTQNLEKYEIAQEGTLASIVTSKNVCAKRFANMILGKVMMCEKYEDLKKHSVSITRECMKYQNRVASAIKPEIFSVPYIGSNAIKVQLQLAKKEREELEAIIKAQEEQIKNLEYVLEPLSTGNDVDIKYRLDVLTRLVIVQTAIIKCRDNINTLKKNATLIQRQIQLEALENMRKELEAEIGDKNQIIGGTKNKIGTKEQNITELLAVLGNQQAAISEHVANAQDSFSGWMRDYEKQTENKSFAQFQENYARRRKANDTLRNNAEKEMYEHMNQYKVEHDFGASASMEGFAEFAAVYDRLRTSEILEYEEKVQSARMAAEEEFREQFLAKLQENMKQAQTEFKNLNLALKDIAFSNEKYEFLYMPSKKNRNYYEMIMDDFNVSQGNSIFSGIFHETHKAVIEELFERLAINNENNEKVLEEFTDYRTYMDYDIKIIHSDNSYSYYSKVCEEKSGGETQTPFYVTVAASFVQLYGNNIGGEAAGLVMFDEAFNNMDDERIGGVLQFLKRLPLQIIIAAPPDKIQYIAPAMEETLLVMTDERISYVEEYYNGAV